MDGFLDGTKDDRKDDLHDDEDNNSKDESSDAGSDVIGNTSFGWDLRDAASEESADEWANKRKEWRDEHLSQDGVAIIRKNHEDLIARMRLIQNGFYAFIP